MNSLHMEYMHVLSERSYGPVTVTTTRWYIRAANPMLAFIVQIVLTRRVSVQWQVNRFEHR